MQQDLSVQELYHTFPIAPVERLDGLVLPVAVGATVGGGSVVNGMLFNRGSPQDYDAWLDLGNDGWGWDDLFPYFMKSSNFSQPKSQANKDFSVTWNKSAWGTDGPVHSSFPAWQVPQQELFIDAIKQTREDVSIWPEGSDESGVSWVPSTQNPDTQTRSSAKTAYYDPVAQRENLKLLVEARVHRIDFRNRSATGVWIRNRHSTGDSLRYISARKEVILAAGPVFSPYLLQVSGVGPRRLLEEAKIQLVHNLPGVGMNLQDTPVINYVWSLPGYRAPQWRDYVRNATLYQEAKREYEQNKTGPLTLCFGNLIASLSLAQIDPHLVDTIRTISHTDFNDYLPAAYTKTVYNGYEAQIRTLKQQLLSPTTGIYEFAFNGWSTTFFNLLEKPLSRGSVLLNTTSPYSSPPVVQYNTLSNPIDTLLISSMVNYTRKLFATSALINEFNPVEILPGSNYTSPQDVISALNQHRRLYPSCSHTSGGCSMMPLELGGVVGSDLKVHGIGRLSVVDSSIIPLLPSARLVHTVYAIAEKASDIIKARHLIENEE
ncbi:uncharacterized protein RHO25_002937 [Cercospora beticola]|uniref:Glucose-methanol-choline oxidoreductase N-terminal domain-containing protein n=2 Tax=Cercospora beticola TaxID=122368 RepID=A0ABZ0NFL5_CERBT|nr:hypothetical protein RHO25_002937 [Cercospora beticola]